MTDHACHVSASPDDQPIPWSKERRSRVSAANRLRRRRRPLTAETKTKQSNSGEAETPNHLRTRNPECVCTGEQEC
jgi:hypothetical protein